MTRTLAVAIVAGGPSSEAEVSRTSARAIEGALAEAGHQPKIVELDEGVAQSIREGGFDVVFPIVHGPLGEDGCLQGLLELLGIPYVGSDVLSSAVAAKKSAAKVLFEAAGLPTAPGLVVRRSDDRACRAALVRERLGRAVVVKPSAAGSAIGVTRLDAESNDVDLDRALDAAFAIGPEALVERFSVGREVTCGVLDDEDGTPRALPPTLILAKAADWYDFESRYAAGGSEHVCPAPFSPALTDRVQNVALEAARALGCRDMSRADLIVGEQGTGEPITLLEVNTLPGFTATSLFPEAAAVAGLPFAALCDRLVRRALAHPTRDRPDVLPMP